MWVSAEAARLSIPRGDLQQLYRHLTTKEYDEVQKADAVVRALDVLREAATEGQPFGLSHKGDNDKAEEAVDMVIKQSDFALAALRRLIVSPPAE